MKRDWYDFKSMNGGYEGARSAFELACETTFRKEYSNDVVQQVKVKQGDGGIDIYIGKLSVKPITVIQCKFFLDDIGSSQKQQITKSFLKAITANEFSVDQWILCVPKTLTLEESIWWNKWVVKQAQKFQIPNEKIRLINGTELIEKMKELQVYDQIFEIKNSLQITKTGQQVEAIYNILTANVANTVVEVPPSESYINDVLFYNYKPYLDKYYLLRTHDHSFASQLKNSHLWIIGKSGSGKTVSINRNLLASEIEYIFCDLSPTVIQSSDDVFKEIYFDLTEYLNIPAEVPNNILKQITKALMNVSSSFVIVVDELSIPNDAIFLELTDKIVRLINHYSNKCGNSGLRFVISTINEPRTTDFNRSKAAEYFEFINVDNWSSDIKRLFDLIEGNLNLSISKASYNYIIENCLNSPRYLKNILKKVCSLSNLTDEQIVEMTKKAKKEFI